MKFRNIIKNILFRIPRKRSGQKHIFIIGIPRSGTTLLKSILITHTQLCGSNWESTGILGFRDIFKYKNGELGEHFVAGAIAESKDIVSFYDRIAMEYIRRHDKRLFVDKLQPRWYRMLYARYFFPNALFLHIVRDGRDCYCSALHHPNVPQKKSLKYFARYWTYNVKLPKRLLPTKRLYTVNYETLTGYPRQTIKQIMDFLQLEFQEKQIKPEYYSSVSNQKNRDVHQNLAKPITATSQKRWQRELTTAENEAFCKIAGKVLQAYNFSLKPTS